jgi:hypothetical protein
VFKSVPDLIDAIHAYPRDYQQPRAVRLDTTAERIPETVRRGRMTLDAITNQNGDAPQPRCRSARAYPATSPRAMGVRVSNRHCFVDGGCVTEAGRTTEVGRPHGRQLIERGSAELVGIRRIAARGWPPPAPRSVRHWSA